MELTQLGGAQPFSTSEKMLAFCLSMAGCEVTAIERRFDQEILFTYGGGQRDPRTKEVIRPSRFSGTSDWDAAQIMWKEGGEGHIEFQFALTQECQNLIKAYRDQREKMKANTEADEKGSDVAAGIMKSAIDRAMSPAEAILRLTCLSVKLRPEFLGIWKQVVPNLYRPVKGKTELIGEMTFRKPGHKFCSLNASPETRKKYGFA